MYRSENAEIIEVNENEETVDLRNELNEKDKKFVEAKSEISLIAT